MPDALTRFVFEYAPVKGGIVQLGETWKTVQSHADYPAPLKKILGELLAAAALLTANIKFEGSMVLQLHGDGPVRLIVVEATSQKTLRATAKWDPAKWDAAKWDAAKWTNDVSAGGTLGELLGHGHFAITLDQSKAGKQNYQGIVDLQGDSVAATLTRYMQSSEQLDTRIYLAANDETVAGMLLQRMPEQKSADEDDWNRAVILADTLKPDELLNVPPGDLLMRLFHEETLRQFAQEPLSFACSCSREKVGNMINMLGQDEVNAILAEQGKIETHCDFCNKQYVFDAVDAALLFSEQPVPAASDTRH